MQVLDVGLDSSTREAVVVALALPRKRNRPGGLSIASLERERRSGRHLSGLRLQERIMVTKKNTQGESTARRAAQQEVAIEALARGTSYEQAGGLAGVTGKTVQRWKRDPAFSRRLADRRGDRLSEVTGLLLDATTDAVAVIRRECLEAEKSSDRLRAAGLLLTMASRLSDRLDVEARLSEVEAFVGLVPVTADLTPGGES